MPGIAENSPKRRVSGLRVRPSVHCRRDRRSSLAFISGADEGCFERREADQNVLLTGVVSHHTDPPDAAAQRSERRSDLDSEIIQQGGADSFTVYAVWDVHPCDVGHLVNLIAEQPQTH